MLAVGVVALVPGLAGCGSGSSNPLRLAAEGPTTTLAGAAPTTTADATSASAPGGSGAAGSTTVSGVVHDRAAATTTTEARPGVDALAAIALTTQPIADIEKLTAMAVRPDDTSIYVTTQTGQVYRIPKGGAPRQGARPHRHRVRIRDRLRARPARPRLQPRRRADVPLLHRPAGPGPPRLLRRRRRRNARPRLGVEGDRHRRTRRRPQGRRDQHRPTTARSTSRSATAAAAAAGTPRT